jgi:hypothetical protein
MNRRDQIAGIILDRLNFYGTWVAEAVLHADVNNRVQPHAALAEFNAARDFLAERGDIAPLARVKGTKWALTEQGKLEVLG